MKTGEIHMKSRESEIVTSFFNFYTSYFIKLDIFSMGISINEAIFILEEESFGYTLPIPTCVIVNESGLFISWQFVDKFPFWKSNNFNIKALRLWNAISHELSKNLSEFGSGNNSLGALFKLLDTNSLKEFEVLRIYDQIYDIRIFAEEILTTNDKNLNTQYRKLIMAHMINESIL